MSDNNRAAEVQIARIEITDCSSEDYWYADHLGQRFNVVELRPSGDFRVVKEVHQDYTEYACVDKEDCRIVGITSGYLRPESQDTGQSGSEGYPDNNPKTRFGVKKVPMHMVPPIAIAHMAMGFADGDSKYDAYNWREKDISSSVYYSAAMRHLMAWWDGEEYAPDSGVHHLAHAMCCMAMVLDGQSTNKLNDDRPVKGVFPRFSGSDHIKETLEAIAKRKEERLNGDR